MQHFFSLFHAHTHTCTHTYTLCWTHTYKIESWILTHAHTYMYMEKELNTLIRSHSHTYTESNTPTCSIVRSSVGQYLLRPRSTFLIKFYKSFYFYFSCDPRTKKLSPAGEWDRWPTTRLGVTLRGDNQISAMGNVTTLSSGHLQDDESERAVWRPHGHISYWRTIYWQLPPTPVARDD